MRAIGAEFAFGIRRTELYGTPERSVTRLMPAALTMSHHFPISAF
jgi:hypothetical protein